MKANNLALAVGLSLAAGTLASSPAQAATDQTVVSALIPEFVTISVGASTVAMSTTAAALQSGATTMESEPMSISIKSNVGGDVYVRARTLDAGDSRASKITPGDLKLKVEDQGAGPGDNQTASNYINYYSPPAGSSGQLIWTNHYEGGVRSAAFTVRFQNINIDKYRGKETPYLNRVEFTITK